MTRRRMVPTPPAVRRLALTSILACLVGVGLPLPPSALGRGCTDFCNGKVGLGVSLKGKLQRICVHDCKALRKGCRGLQRTDRQQCWNTAGACAAHCAQGWPQFDRAGRDGRLGCEVVCRDCYRQNLIGRCILGAGSGQQSSSCCTSEPGQGLPQCCGSGCCTIGQTCCGGGCVDTTADLENCGACGRPCAPNESCVGGLCSCCTQGTCPAPSEPPVYTLRTIVMFPGKVVETGVTVRCGARDEAGLCASPMVRCFRKDFQGERDETCSASVSLGLDNYITRANGAPFCMTASEICIPLSSCAVRLGTDFVQVHECEHCGALGPDCLFQQYEGCVCSENRIVCPR